MNDPYSAIDAQHERREAEDDHKSREIDKEIDNLLTAVINGEEYSGYNFEDVIGYLDDEGYETKCEFLRQSINIAVMPATSLEFARALTRAAIEIVVNFDRIKRL